MGISGNLKHLARRPKAAAARRVSNRVHRAFDEYSRDIDLERQRQALVSTAEFVDAHMGHLTGFRGDHPNDARMDHLRWNLDRARDEGLVLEFGVAGGASLREIASVRGTAHGFDSFEGLPEHWRPGYEEASFAQPIPDVGAATLHIGWFDETLPPFLVDHREPFAFVHADADLYSSTTTIFDLCFDRFRSGTVIVFDEYFNYPGWQEHEHKAFMEFIDRFDGGFEYVSYNAMHEQVGVILT